MVRGLDLFRDRFRSFGDSYVIIGSSACSVAMEAAGLEFRSTKDLDIVLLAEALKPAFFAAFWEFVHNGKYEHMQRSTSKNTFYRFTNPGDAAYPHMLELFSRVPDALDGKIIGHLTPVPAGDAASSLSAILLEDNYYRFIRQGTMTLDGLSVARPEYLVPLKAKAWLDLGEQVDSTNINKHLKDIVSLFRIVNPGDAFGLSGAVRNDMLSFIAKASSVSSNIMELKPTIEQYYGLIAPEVL
jgi:hypothetical protein